jgi:hypothetical protein
MAGGKLYGGKIKERNSIMGNLKEVNITAENSMVGNTKENNRMAGDIIVGYYIGGN